MTNVPPNTPDLQQQLILAFEQLQVVIEKTPAGTIREELIQSATYLMNQLAVLLTDHSAKAAELEKIYDARAQINMNGAANVEEELEEVFGDPEFESLNEKDRAKIIVYIAQEKLLEENIRLTQTHSANSGWEYWYQLGAEGTREAFTEKMNQLKEELKEATDELEEKENNLHQTTRRLKKQERINRNNRNSGF